MHTRADISLRSRGIRPCGDRRIIPHADQVHHLRAGEVAITIEVDLHRRLGVQRLALALGLVIEIIHLGIGRIIPLRHHMKGLDRHLVVGVILGPGFHVLLMPGMIGDILRPHHLWLLREGLEQLSAFNIIRGTYLDLMLAKFLGIYPTAITKTPKNTHESTLIRPTDLCRIYVA